MGILGDTLRYILDFDTSKAIKSINEVADTAKQKLGGELSDSTTRMGSLVETATNKFPALGKALDATGLSANAAGQALAFGLGAAGIGAAVKVAETGISAFQDLGYQVLQLERATGLGAQEASKFAEVLKDYNVPAEAGATVLGKFTKNLGTNEQAFKALGITVSRNKDGAFDYEKTLENVADAYNRATDQTQKAEIASKAFGKQWTTVIPLLEGGAQGLQEKLSAVGSSKILSEDQVKEAEQFRLTIDELKDRLEGMEVAIGKGLVPALKAFVGQLADILGYAEKLHILDFAAKFFVPISQMAQESGAWLDKFTAKLAELNRPMVDYGSALAQARDANVVTTKAIDLSTQALEKQAQAAVDAENAQLTAIDSANAYANAQDSSASADRAVTVARDALAGKNDKLNATTKTAAQIAHDLADKQRALLDAQEKVTQATQGVADAQAHLNEVMAGHTKEVWNQYDADKALYDAQLGLQTSQLDVADAADNLTAKVKTQTEIDADQTSTAQDKEKAHREVLRAQIALQKAQEAYAQSVKNVADTEKAKQDGPDKQAKENATELKDAQDALRNAQQTLVDQIGRLGDAQFNLNDKQQQGGASAKSAAQLQQDLTDALRRQQDQHVTTAQAAGKAAEDAYVAAQKIAGLPVDTAHEFALKVAAQTKALEDFAKASGPDSDAYKNYVAWVNVLLGNGNGGPTLSQDLDEIKRKQSNAGASSTAAVAPVNVTVNIGIAGDPIATGQAIIDAVNQWSLHNGRSKVF